MRLVFGPPPCPYPLTPVRVRAGVAARPAAPPAPPAPPTAPDPTAFAVSIQGDPIPQPRHRSTVLPIRNKVTGHVIHKPVVYLPKKDKVNDYKRDIRKAVSERLPADWVLTDPVAVACLFVCHRPKKTPKKLGRTPKTTKPDSDNYLKAVLDACKSVVWADDAQVAATLVVKVVAAEHDDPHTILAFSRRSDDIVSGAWAGRLSAFLVRS